MRNPIAHRAACALLLSTSLEGAVACARPACDGYELQVASVTVGGIPPGMRPGLAAHALAGHCPAALPREYSEWLVATARRAPGDPRSKSLRSLVTVSPAPWAAACPAGEAVLAKAESLPDPQALREVWHACGFDKLGFATEQDFLATAGNDNLGVEAALVAPALFAWLRKANGEPAAVLTRALAGIPAPVRILESDELQLPTSTSRGSAAAPDLLVTVSKKNVLVADQIACSVEAGRLAGDCLATLEKRLPKRGTVGLACDRLTPFATVSQVWQAVARAGSSPRLLAHGGRAWTPLLDGPTEPDALALHLHLGADGVTLSGEGGTLPDRPARRDYTALGAKVAEIKKVFPDLNRFSISADEDRSRSWSPRSTPAAKSPARREKSSSPWPPCSPPRRTGPRARRSTCRRRCQHPPRAPWLPSSEGASPSRRPWRQARSTPTSVSTPRR